MTTRKQLLNSARKGGRLHALLGGMPILANLHASDCALYECQCSHYKE